LTLFADVVQLAANVATGAYDYGRAIIEMWSRHQLIGAARVLEDLAQNVPVDPVKDHRRDGLSIRARPDEARSRNQQKSRARARLFRVC
jgi:hypothetical protein